MRRWRKMTWALVVWTALVALWIGAGVSAVSDNCAGATDLAVCQAGTAIGGGIAITIQLTVWFLGFVVLAIIWFMSRPHRNVTVYGPEGQQMLVTEREARDRVQKGWTYQPRT